MNFQIRFMGRNAELSTYSDDHHLASVIKLICHSHWQAYDLRVQRLGISDSTAAYYVSSFLPRSLS